MQAVVDYDPVLVCFFFGAAMVVVTLLVVVEAVWRALTPPAPASSPSLAENVSSRRQIEIDDDTFRFENQQLVEDMRAAGLSKFLRAKHDGWDAVMRELQARDLSQV